MRIEPFFFILFFVSVFVSSVSQVMLKTGADKKYKNKIAEYMNPLVIIAYTLFLLSSIMTVFGYKGVPLSMGAIIEASGYIWVTVLGAFFLKEKINKKKLMGIVLILVGIVIFNLG